MGLFDTLKALKVAKDIVKGGIATYKSEEKLDGLIARSIDTYQDVLTQEEQNLYSKLKFAKQRRQNSHGKDQEDLQQKEWQAKTQYLEALESNDSLPQEFRDEIASAVREFKKSVNFALESFESTVMEQAESEEQKEQVRGILNDFKVK